MNIVKPLCLLIAIGTVTSSVLVGTSLLRAEPASRPEAEYARQAAAELGGELEQRQDDGTRVDIVTDRHAIEVDRAPKWAEAIGQALHYGLMTGLRPGIVLILESPSDYRYLLRLNSNIRHYNLPIDVWTIDADGEIERTIDQDDEQPEAAGQSPGREVVSTCGHSSPEAAGNPNCCA